MKGIHQQREREREKLPSSNEPLLPSLEASTLFCYLCVCALLRHLLDCQFSTRCPEISGCYCDYGHHYYVRSFRKKKQNERSKLAQRKNADNRGMLTRWNNRPERIRQPRPLKKVTLAEEMFRVIPLNVCSQHAGCVQQQQVFFLYIHPPAR